jgi:hypothetical protein
MARTMLPHGCGGDAADGFREIDLPVDLAALVALLLTSTFGNNPSLRFS